MCLLRTIYLSINYLEPTFKAVDVEIKVSAASAGDIWMPQASNKTLKLTQHFDFGSSRSLLCLFILQNLAKSRGVRNLNSIT